VQRQAGHADYVTTVDIYGSWLRVPRPDLVKILYRQSPLPPPVTRPGPPTVTQTVRKAGTPMSVPLCPIATLRGSGFWISEYVRRYAWTGGGGRDGQMAVSANGE
jgi:hypothetical protein